MHVLFLCGREVEYPRNQVILRALQRIATVKIIAEHGPARSLSLRNLRIAMKAIPSLLFSKYDLIFVGFYGYWLVLESRLLNRSPILFDAFVSNYDTLVSDRMNIRPGSFAARFLRWLDRTACNSARQVLLDTSAQIAYFVREFGLTESIFDRLPVGAVDALFHPAPVVSVRSRLRILYYCTYLPLHGVSVIVEAANQIKDLNCEIVLIGRGPEYSRTRVLADQYHLPNLTFMDNLSLENLAVEIRNADICLGGHFGTSPKAARTIPGKIYQFLAVGKPVIATSTPANQELLVHLENAYLCAPADPASLAQAMRILSQDETLRTRLAENGRQTYLESCSEEVLQRQIAEIVQRMIG